MMDTDDYIVVLNDGETYTNLSGCRIMRIPDTVDVDLDESAIRRAFSNGAGALIEDYLDDYGIPNVYGPDYLQLWEDEDE